MTRFDDLGPYTYLPRDGCCRGPMVTVGWLEAGTPFPRGPVPASVVEALRALDADPHHVTRGVHACDLCLAAGRPPELGSTEIHVPGDGVVYAAPHLVIHYVVEHGYRPPEEFLAAVERSAGS